MICNVADKDTPASAVLDLGTLVDAIHLARGAHLELWRLHIPNSGDRKVKRPSERVRINVAGAFALWPSVTVAKDSKVPYSSLSARLWSKRVSLWNFHCMPPPPSAVFAAAQLYCPYRRAVH